VAEGSSTPACPTGATASAVRRGGAFYDLPGVLERYRAARPTGVGAPVVWHRRTIEAYVAALQDASFDLVALRECEPRRERFGGDEAELARRRRIPLFLLLAGTRR
jgi:hypothetical protein